MKTARPTLDSIDLGDPELFRHGFPHDVFTVLREQAPVWRHPDTPGTKDVGRPFWVVSRHADIDAVSRDHEHFRSYEGPSIPDWDPNARGLTLIAMDPPDHSRLRRLVNRGFTPRMIAMLEDQVQSWAATVVDHALEKGECNFVDEVACQLPMHMIADIVGIPGDDRAELFGLVRKMLDTLDPQSGRTEVELAESLGKTYAYAHELAEEKRRSPRDDVWSKLTTAEVEHPDGTSTRLSELELDLFFILLVIAGSETTRDSISAGLLALLEHPAQMEHMRRDPSVLDTAVEEIVRWTSPTSYFGRTATRDVILHDARIEAGDRVSLWYASANRDAAVFTDPFRFDVTRNPNPHVGFGGHGVHYCLGANLARRNIKMMFSELFARAKKIEMLGEPSYRSAGITNMITCSLKDLPVRLLPA
ncbi:cytochrome P450 [Mycobacterium sp.]|uniref:cytochrome P450 n=1 Tax=Mycobacterium sp. TaxID=1785 RepID=UPI003C71623B